MHSYFRFFITACCLLGFVNTCFCGEEPKLVMRELMPHGFTYSPAQDGVLYVAFCSDGSGGEFGPVMVWKPGAGGKLINIGGLSSLDEILRGHIQRLGENQAKNVILGAIAPAIAEYIQLQSQGVIVYPSYKEEFLEKLKSKVSESIYNVVKSGLVYTAPQGDANVWSAIFFVLKQDGALERERFSGEFRPFSIKKRETEVVVEAGVIPKADYIQM